jgi:hypothetical protein
MGSLATAVNALPGAVAAAASAKARELVGVVSAHAWRAAPRLRPDPEDVRTTRGVASMLAYFISSTTLDAEDARHVLSRVGAATWSGCFEEVAFLEAEMLERLETGGEDNNDLMLIASLLAFLLYCRIFPFDRIDDSDKAEATAPVARLPPRCTVLQGTTPITAGRTCLFDRIDNSDKAEATAPVARRRRGARHCTGPRLPRPEERAVEPVWAAQVRRLGGGDDLAVGAQSC